MESKNLNLYYDDFRALIDVNVPIYEKKITALIGPSGCGKSSFIRCLNRMNDLLPNAKVEGIITLDGKNIYDKDVDVVDLRKRVGMVFQKPNPFPMSVYDNVAFGPRIHGIKDKKTLDKIVEDSLKKAALWDDIDVNNSEELHKKAEKIRKLITDAKMPKDLELSIIESYNKLCNDFGNGEDIFL